MYVSAKYHRKKFILADSLHISTMKSYWIVSLVIFLLTCRKSSEMNANRARLTQIILVGATGDLAKKYLWKGLLGLYNEQNNPEEIIKIYGAARMDLEKGKKHLKNILESTLKCPLNKDEMRDCEKQINQFKQQVQYHKLKTDDDYKALCKDLNAEVPDESKTLERMFYLSVPPSAYSSIAKSINNYCRPLHAVQDNKDASLKVILEKPFGSDLTSAKKLAQDLQQFFKEEEIYRIDHYLGKTGVAQIMTFRDENRNTFGNLWNRDYIDSVEIAMKEKEDCRGRTRFYDEYGVIRDVIQNHLTEVLSLVAMETPSDINNVTEFHQEKIRFLQSVKTLHRYSAVIGQYRDYVKHCEADHGKPIPSSYNTPTFAAVLLFLKTSKWNGVPFVLLSGKQLQERTAYVRIIFKKKYTVKSSYNNCFLDQVIFHIQGGGLKEPALIISKSLPTISKLSGWKPMHSKPDYLYDCPGESFNIFEPIVSHDAYSALIKAAYHGKQDLFVGTEDLIASWEIWTPLLDSLKPVIPRIYSKDTLGTLDFSIRGQTLEYSHSAGEKSCTRDELDNESCDERSSNIYKKNLFREQPLVTGSSDEVVRTLAENILQKASLKVKAGSAFHLALSGGSSPLPLFRHLAFFCPDFPWHSTHVWLVDERCKPLTDKHSNYRFIYENLLEYVPIPRSNIHPMPVSLQNGLCAVNDRGDSHYEADIRTRLAADTDKSLDFVLLGVGQDGHTASLFPGSESLSADNWVIIAESKQVEPVGQRMTMTYNLLNKAKSIAVLVLGSKKADIVQKLAEVSNIDRNEKQLPITGINPQSNVLKWYIDDKAMEKLY